MDVLLIDWPREIELSMIGIDLFSPFPHTW